MATKENYIQRLKTLHREKTGKTLSDLEAMELFEKLITLVHTIYRPILKEIKNEFNT